MRILVIADGVIPTGFSRVSHGIFDNFDSSEYEIHWFAINYNGSPHSSKHNLYPTAIFGSREPYGFDRLGLFKDTKFDLIFILNDVFIVNKYLEVIKNTFDKVPPVVVYTPVDSLNHSKSWYENFDVVKKLIAYNEYGKSILEQHFPSRSIEVIPHGIDLSVFYKIDKPKEEIRKELLDRSDFINAPFIIFNGNRNQPRKQIWRSLMAFSIFSKNKPDVRFYYHGGIIDADINVIELAEWLGIQDKLILTNLKRGVQTVSNEYLNLIYNATDVGVNSSIGEGWGLVNVEHAVTGAPQIIPAHSSFIELFSDCGFLIKPTDYHVNPNISTIGLTVSVENLANAYEELYRNENLRAELSKKSIEKFTHPKYDWVNISNRWKELFKEVV